MRVNLPSLVALQYIGSTLPKGETRIRLVGPTSCRAWLHISLGFQATLNRLFSLSMRGKGLAQNLLG